MATLREQISRCTPVGRVSGEGGAEAGKDELTRTIGLIPLASIGIGGTIGTGIFFILNEAVPIARSTPSCSVSSRRWPRRHGGTMRESALTLAASNSRAVLARVGSTG